MSSDGNPTYDEFMQELEGSIHCGCDHGCNQWIKKQECRVVLGYRMMKLGSPNLDKMAQMPIERVRSIFYWVQRQESRRYNENSRKSGLYSYFKEVLEIGEEHVLSTIALQDNNLAAAAESLNINQPEASEFHKPYDIRPYVLSSYLKYVALSLEEQTECQQQWTIWNKK